MLIDDGDINERKMRENLLDANHRYIAFATGKHKFQGGMCVAMLCLEFLDHDEIKDMHDRIKYSDR